MGKQTPISVNAEIAGTNLVLESGKLAALADGSVVLKCKKMILLATAVSVQEASQDADFFPLSVDYREKFAAAGRVPGNFHKREGRPSDYEVLTSRLIDRVIRPLFPDSFLNETQIFVYLLSGDKELAPEAYAALAASAALMTSTIPFMGPISEVRVARIHGQIVVNPGIEELKESDMTFMVGGSADNIVMVEGEAKECQEADMIEAIKIAHQVIKEQCRLQLELRAALGITENRKVVEPDTNEEIEKETDAFVRHKIHEIAISGTSKLERKKAFASIKEELTEAMTKKHGEEYVEANSRLYSSYYKSIQKDTIREMILSEKVRLDGRKPDEIRPIWCEVDYLPSTHGSAIFTRGETQSLTTVTLGSKLDESLVDNAMSVYHDRFMLHYNFPPFCTNEVKRPRGVSRREVGHGTLARRSLEQVFPQEYEYTVRIVSDILESNGSSSMATVCAGTLALMDSGIPISAPVSGIAMGLITDGKRSVVLSDILGDEDHLGDMDFKVTGTANGICACQMDIKIDGLDYELLASALEQARKGRLHILDIMAATIEKPNENLKPHAPRIVRLEIDSKDIGAVIGPGGRVIQSIQKDTDTTITVEEKGDKGIVYISGVGKTTVDSAVATIKAIITEPEIGETYLAKVSKIMPYGAFVEFLPGKEGLLHVSEISWTRIENVEDAISEGDTIKVRLLGIDIRTGKFKLSRKVLMPKPEGYVERPPRENRDGRRGGDRRNYNSGRKNDRRR